jgi:hypothetical protein
MTNAAVALAVAVAAAQTLVAQSAPRLRLQMQDYAQLPITGELDGQNTRGFTVYLDFNGLGGRPGLFPNFTFERNFATGLINFLFDPDYAQSGVF